MTNPIKCTALLLAICCALALAQPVSASAAEKQLSLLATTFPIYQITRNIITGTDDVRLELLIPAAMGCPHDYALAPRDMHKLAQADLLIVNGLGLEEFLGAPVSKANPRLIVLDSTKDIGQILQYADEDSHEDEQHDHAKASETPAGPHQHHHDTPNPHLFASPRMVALLAQNIAKGLAQRNPGQAQTYTANAERYAREMNILADDLARLGKRLANNRIVTQHGVFDYLARDIGLEVVAVVQAHAGQDPAASEFLDVVKTIRHKKAGAVFTEPQYPEAVGKKLAQEAGIATAILDPAANGPEDAPMDYYQQVMQANMKTLEKTLGSH